MSKIRNSVVIGPINQMIEPPAEGLEEHEITANISLPKEGGWGWVVVAAAFFMIFILDGVIYTFGSLMVDMAEDFQESNTLISMVNSVASALYLLISPLASALINKFGFRICAMTGSSICSFSLLASYFTRKYAYLMLFYGIFTGIGTSLINMSASLIVGFYFEKLRAFAMSITNCGSSIGCVFMFPLNSYLVSLTGWRTATLLHSGLFGISYFLGMTFRPLQSVSVSTEEEGVLMRSVVYLPSVASVAPRQSTTALGPIPTAHANERLFRTLSNSNFPTAAAVIDSTGAALTSASTSAPSTSKDTKEPSPANRHSRVVLVPNVPSSQKHRVKSVTSATNLVKQMSLPKAESEEPKGFWEKMTNFEAAPERPLYRDDAFYDGDIKRLPEYQKSVVEATGEVKTGLEYQLAVTRAASVHDLQEHRGVLSTAVRRVLVTMMDPVLLKSKDFCLMCLSGFCICLGFFVPYVYLKDRNTHGGMDASQCSILMSVMAGSNTAGRLGLGTAAAKINPLSLYAASVTTAGVSTMLSSMSYSPAYQFLYAIIFGFTIASVASLRSLCLVNLFGLDKLTNATGMMLIFLGIGTMIGTPLAGLIQSSTGSYVTPFLVAGGFITIGGIILIYLRIISKEEMDKKNNKEKPKEKEKHEKPRKVQHQVNIDPSEKPKGLDILDPEKYEKYLIDKYNSKLTLVRNPSKSNVYNVHKE